MPPRVLIGSPVSSLKEYCIPSYARALKSLTYKNKKFLIVDDSPQGHEVRRFFEGLEIGYERASFNENIRQMLADCRNILRKKALEENFDYLLLVEQDVIPPHNVVESLLSNDKKIVSAAFFNFSHQKDGPTPQPNHFCLINPKDNYTMITRRLAFDDLWPSRLIKIFLTGVGCILIHKSVLEEIEFRVDKNLSAYDDLFFCRDANKKGFEIFLDSRVLCMHLNRPWST